MVLWLLCHRRSINILNDDIRSRRWLELLELMLLELMLELVLEMVLARDCELLYDCVCWRRWCEGGGWPRGLLLIQEGSFA